MKTATDIPIFLDFEMLETEWNMLTSAQEKEQFWQKMKKLLANSDKTQVELFFEQLNLSANKVSDSLERALVRAKAAGFKAESIVWFRINPVMPAIPWSTRNSRSRYFFYRNTAPPRPLAHYFQPFVQIIVLSTNYVPPSASLSIKP